MKVRFPIAFGVSLILIPLSGMFLIIAEIAYPVSQQHLVEMFGIGLLVGIIMLGFSVVEK